MVLCVLSATLLSNTRVRFLKKKKNVWYRSIGSHDGETEAVGNNRRSSDVDEEAARYRISVIDGGTADDAIGAQRISLAIGASAQPHR